MKVETRTHEPTPQAPPDGFASADLAALDEELFGIRREEQERLAKVERARQLDQALSAVTSATENVRLLNVELARYDATLAIFRKLAKLVDTIPEGTIGGRPGRNSFSDKPSIELVDDIGGYLNDTVASSMEIIQQRRGRTVESIRASEERLLEAQNSARQLR